MAKKSPYPKCFICGKKATRWDGGICALTLSPKGPKPAPIGWACEKHDPHHKAFDLPADLPGAIAELVILRELLQEMFERAVKAEARS